MKVRFIICECCEKKVRDHSFNPDSKVYQKMISECLCYECAYWKNLIENWKETYIVIDHVLYDFQPSQVDRANICLGSNGRNYYALINGQAIYSNDVWVKGMVPERFRDKIPNMGFFITQKTYEILRSRTSVCKSKGCYDRYHCLLYDHRNEYKSGPYNIIPRTWVAGNENCKFFVDIRSIRGFDPIIDSEHFLDILKTQENEKVHLSKKNLG